MGVKNRHRIRNTLAAPLAVASFGAATAAGKREKYVCTICGTQLVRKSARPDPMIGECPHCREDIRLDASVCPHCQRKVTPLSPDGEPDYSAWATEDAPQVE